MTSEQTVKCPICGKPYITYSHYAGDQSACPKCRGEARKNDAYGHALRQEKPCTCPDGEDCWAMTEGFCFHDGKGGEL